MNDLRDRVTFTEQQANKNKKADEQMLKEFQKKDEYYRKKEQLAALKQNDDYWNKNISKMTNEHAYRH